MKEMLFLVTQCSFASDGLAIFRSAKSYWLLKIVWDSDIDCRSIILASWKSLQIDGLGLGCKPFLLMTCLSGSVNICGVLKSKPLGLTACHPPAALRI